MVSSGSLLNFLGATVLPKASPEDRPLLTAIVGEAGSKVCAQKLNKKSCPSIRGQQEAAEDTTLQAGTLADRITTGAFQTHPGRPEGQRTDQVWGGGGKECPC